MAALKLQGLGDYIQRKEMKERKFFQPRDLKCIKNYTIIIDLSFEDLVPLLNMFDMISQYDLVTFKTKIKLFIKYLTQDLMVNKIVFYVNIRDTLIQNIIQNVLDEELIQYFTITDCDKKEEHLVS